MDHTAETFFNATIKKAGMDYTRHGHNKPGEWLEYLTTQHDVGIQTNPNYDLAQPHDDSRATEGDFKDQLSCRP